MTARSSESLALRGGWILAVALISLACSARDAGVPALGSGGAGSQGGSANGGTQYGGTTPIGGTPGGAGVTFNTPPPMSNGCGSGEVDVLFVIDRSGSMNCNLPPITSSSDCEASPERANELEPSKWDVVKAAFSSAFDSLLPQDDAVTLRVGLSFFSVDDVCGARSTPTIALASVTPTQIDLLRQSLELTTPAGGTPIVGATILAYDHLYQPETFTGTGHVILLTDGADSCSESYETSVGPGDHIADLINVEAPKALSVGIKTWVIGAPGSEPARTMLSSLAVAGGTGREGCDPAGGDCHYDMTNGDFEQTLKDTLASIAEVVTCQIR